MESLAAKVEMSPIPLAGASGERSRQTTMIE
jgi:hypothetical protein